MIKDIIIKNLTKYDDERGWLCEMFRNDETNFKPEMGYVSMTNPGISRGPHEHISQSDFFIFTGPGTFKLYLWDNRKNSETYKEKIEIIVGEENPCSVIVPPGVVHGYKCISETPAFSINLPNKLYKGQEKSEEVDEIRHENQENSEFKISNDE